MTAAKASDQFEDRLSLKSQLSDIARVPAWIEAVTASYAISAKIKSAVNLCLEEALSNVIQHGYGGEAGHTVNVQFKAPREGYFVFVIEDEAPRFNPLSAPRLPAIDAEESDRVGGQGIRFLHRFAHTLEYEPTPTGNQLRIGFYAAGIATQKD